MRHSPNFQYHFGQEDFLGFEIFTLVPFEPHLIEYDLLTSPQVQSAWDGLPTFLYEVNKWNTCATLVILISSQFPCTCHYAHAYKFILCGLQHTCRGLHERWISILHLYLIACPIELFQLSHCFLQIHVLYDDVCSFLIEGCSICMMLD